MDAGDVFDGGDAFAGGDDAMPDAVDVFDRADTPAVMDADGDVVTDHGDTDASVDADARVDADVPIVCATTCAPGQSCTSADSVCRYRVRKVAVGGHHACALMEGGAVYCWGDNDAGQLGLDGSVTQRLRPTLVPGVSGATDIAVPLTASYSCAIVGVEGAEICWGANGYRVFDGPDGSAPETAVFPPTRTGRVGVRELSLGGSHACALGVDGRVSCWGINANGQLGTGTSSALTVQRSGATPVQVRTEFDRVDLTDVRHVSAKGNHTCAVVRRAACSGMDAGLCDEVYCWGNNDERQLGRADGELTLAGPVMAITNVATVVVGVNHSCVLQADGRMQCWGGNCVGAIGAGPAARSVLPTEVRVGDGGRFGAIAAGQQITCASWTAGDAGAESLWCWGGGRLGYDAGMSCVPDSSCPVNTIACNLAPREVQGTTGGSLSGVRQIAIGPDNACAVTDEGGVFCWGPGLVNGDGVEQERVAPVRVLFPDAPGP